ncbi:MULTISPECIES: DUF742 domain-containing protein [unclassified Streptomyces]|uniref:DUF742 domain-containing protein n=1 Tax=unclassified Streptomyces TaxID=2593676 RepID=UPI001C2E09A5|nr:MULTISPECIES: DUF742 domain-containing protein [unclassified Streptomyces]MBV1949115.1 DUF742 domain-containing protein [Streptomyces sp. BV129]
MTPEGSVWSNEALGAVRPYALVRGRVTPTHALARHELLRASTDPPTALLQPHHAQVLSACGQQGPRSVTEIAGRAGLPLQVTRILLSDLLDDGYLVAEMPAGFLHAGRDPHILERVLAGLRHL